MEFLSPDQEIFFAWNIEGAWHINNNISALNEWFLMAYLQDILNRHHSTIQDLNNKTPDFKDVFHNRIIEIFNYLNSTTDKNKVNSIHEGLSLIYKYQNGNKIIRYTNDLYFVDNKAKNPQEEKVVRSSS